ncbi:MAG TPA: CopG family transcriptional regulator [Terriglobales bacterium]|jgi:hypothetical protein|nr:CopG family transcriptional regulator [Terriglobales bacterium]
MAKRLQVSLQDPEYEAIQRAAYRSGISIAEWVRQELISALQRESDGSVTEKVKAIRAAVRHSYPTGDMDTILQQIETGYSGQ